MTLLSFFVMIVVANYSAGDDIADFNGLSKRSPFLAFAMLIAMVSLAGLPLHRRVHGQIPRLPGRHFAKAIPARGHRRSGGRACGFYYYLRVVRAMYFQPLAIGPEASGAITLTLLTRGTIALLIAAIFVLGIYPLPFLGASGTRSPLAASAAVPGPAAPPVPAQSLNSTFQ